MVDTRAILLVEDTASDEALTLHALAALNIANPVIVVRDGAEALDYLFRTGRYAARPATPPQVILLDLKLPKIDGLDVLKQLRANPLTQDIPVVIFTSSKEEQDIVEGYRLGANSYVRKPVEYDSFMAAVHELGLFWTQVNEPVPTKL